MPAITSCRARRRRRRVSLKHGVDTDCADFGEGPEAGAKAIPTLSCAGLVPQSVMDNRSSGFSWPASGWACSIRRRPRPMPRPPRQRNGFARPSRLGAEGRARKHGAAEKLRPAAAQALREAHLVVGPLADQVPVMLGNYNGQPSRAVTALDGIKAAFPAAQVTYVPGTNFLRPLEVVPTTALRTAEGQPAVRRSIFPREDLSVSGAPHHPEWMRSSTSPSAAPRRCVRCGGGARRPAPPVSPAR